MKPAAIASVFTAQNEYDWIEEITATKVVIRLWDLRRLIVPLNYFIRQSLDNWAQRAAANMGSVLLDLDYTAPIDRIREKAIDLVSQSKEWTGKVINV